MSLRGETVKPIDIGPHDLETVRSILQEHVSELDVWAFGSRVSWTARETSDLDIALMTAESLDVMRLAKMREAFTQSDLSFRVDIVDWSSTSEDFQEIIKMEHVVLAKVDHSSKWSKIALGNITPFAYGKNLPKQKRNSTGNVPVFGSNGIIDYHNIALTNEPTIIIGRKGTVGNVHYSPVPCWPIDTTFFITDNDTDLARFKYYALKTLGLEHMNTDSAVPRLNRNAAHDLLLPVPENSEQRVIAHILGTLDDKIEMNLQINRTLEEMAQALFKSWFVNFEPVRARMDGRWSPGESLPGLPARLYDLFPDCLVDSRIGKIPNGWKIGVLDDAIELLGGGTPRTSIDIYWGGDIPWYTAKDAPSPSDIFVLDTERTITQAGIANSSAKILPIRTTVITARGTVGRLACLGTPMAMNQTCYGIRGIQGYSDFFTYWNVRMAVDQLQRQVHGAIFDTITRQTFKIVDTVLPPTALSDVFESTVSSMMERMLGNARECRTLSAQRDALLPKLMSGELHTSQLVCKRNMQK